MADNRELDIATVTEVGSLDEGLIRARLQSAREKAEQLVRVTGRAPQL